MVSSRTAPVNKLRHLLKVGLDKAAAGERGGAHAQAAWHHGADVACGGGCGQWGAVGGSGVGVGAQGVKRRREAGAADDAHADQAAGASPHPTSHPPPTRRHRHLAPSIQHPPGTVFLLAAMWASSSTRSTREPSTPCSSGGGGSGEAGQAAWAGGRRAHAVGQRQAGSAHQSPLSLHLTPTCVYSNSTPNHPHPHPPHPLPHTAPTPTATPIHPTTTGAHTPLAAGRSARCGCRCRR